MERRALSVKEFAAVFGLSLSSTYDLIKTRRLAVLRLGRSLRVPAAEVEAFERRHLVPAREPRR